MTQQSLLQLQPLKRLETISMFHDLQSMMQAPDTNPEKQDDWARIIDESAYTLQSVCEDHDFKEETLRAWLKSQRKPQKRFQERIVETMRQLKQTRPMVKHPSYGYATEERSGN